MGVKRKANSYLFLVQPRRGRMLQTRPDPLDARRAVFASVLGDVRTARCSRCCCRLAVVDQFRRRGSVGFACYSLFPARYAAVGAVSGLPFAVIGVLAAWRQWQAPSAAKVDATLCARVDVKP